VLAGAPSAGRDREGARVELTLDQGLQLAAERALARAVAGSRALSGIAIALDPRTGEVLAIAGAPAFNPNAVRRGGELRNRAVADSFEPGSTMKTFTVAGALDRGALKPLDPIDCGDGSLAIGAHVIHDHAPLGWVGASKVLAASSNVGAARIGARLGKQGLSETLAAFGFGERSGLGLPGEAKGQLPFPRSDIALATQSFGQGLTATALQVTNAMAAIANGGVLMRPTLVKRVVDPATGEVLEEARPEAVRRAVSAETAATVSRWLVGVLEDEKGTGRRARLDGWRAAGKTGTAQKADPVSGGYSADRHFSSFVGFAPAEAPRIVVGVFVDEPKGEIYGGEVAAPPFREIAEYAMKMLGVPPTGPAVAAAPAAAEPAGEAPEEPAGPPPVEQAARRTAVAGGGIAVPALAGLPARAAIRTLESVELGAELRGSGRVVAQVPAPGKVVARGTRVRMTLAPAG
jgi:cell division protein FtsI (penicillin-binding protein 3)